MDNKPGDKGVPDCDTVEYYRWQETLEALDSACRGRVIDGDTVHQWLQSWGTDEERSLSGF